MEAAAMSPKCGRLLDKSLCDVSDVSLVSNKQMSISSGKDSGKVRGSNKKIGSNSSGEVARQSNWSFEVSSIHKKSESDGNGAMSSLDISAINEEEEEKKEEEKKEEEKGDASPSYTK